MEPEERADRTEAPSKRLFRDPINGPLFGVCTGIAQYLGAEPWIVRLVCVAGVICIGWAVVPAYLLAIFIMDVRPDGYEDPLGHNNRYRRTIKRRGRARSKRERADDDFAQPSSFHWRMSAVRREIGKMDRKLQRMESYITSGRYELFKEFENLKD